MQQTANKNINAYIHYYKDRMKRIEKQNSLLCHIVLISLIINIGLVLNGIIVPAHQPPITEQIEKTQTEKFFEEITPPYNLKPIYE